MNVSCFKCYHCFLSRLLTEERGAAVSGAPKATKDSEKNTNIAVLTKKLEESSERSYLNSGGASIFFSVKGVQVQECVKIQSGRNPKIISKTDKQVKILVNSWIIKMSRT